MNRLYALGLSYPKKSMSQVLHSPHALLKILLKAVVTHRHPAETRQSPHDSFRVEWKKVSAEILQLPAASSCRLHSAPKKSQTQKWAPWSTSRAA